MSYSFSATTIEDPPINQTGSIDERIPIIFAQPNILTSKITPTFAYDSRQPSSNGIDTLRGTQITASLNFAGLAGMSEHTSQISLIRVLFRFGERTKQVPKYLDLGFKQDISAHLRQRIRFEMPTPFHLLVASRFLKDIFLAVNLISAALKPVRLVLSPRLIHM